MSSPIRKKYQGFVRTSVQGRADVVLHIIGIM